MSGALRSAISLGVCILLLVLLTFNQSTAHQQADQGIRIDVPADGHVRLENNLGSIQIQVWNEKYVMVSAVVEGEASPRRSPVVIENRNRLLLVSIVRNPVGPRVAIQLSVKVPSGVHTEVITKDGAVSLTGMPASASIRTVSGDIQTQFEASPNLDVSARSANGLITSQLDTPLSVGGHALQARLGTGERVLRINSESGSISLLLATPAPKPVAESRDRPPSLIGDNNPGGAGTPAVDGGIEEVSEGDVIRVDSQLVTLNVSVIDRNSNRGLLGLTESDFKLFEDGAEQRILKFDSASAPFDLILLIDLSGSTREMVKLIRQAALRFVDAARPADRIGIITFAGQSNLVAPVMLDRERLRRSIETIDTASGDTKLYDATNFALQTLSSERGNSRRTAIVLMSDGLDGTVPGVFGQQGSKLQYAELLNKIQEFDGVLYTLWLNTYYEALNPRDTQPEAFETGHDRMSELGEAGGGMFYEVERLEDLAGAYERVVADLGTVYSLAYRPSNKTRDGKWRAIRVGLSRPSAVARGKHGYYAN